MGTPIPISMVDIGTPHYIIMSIPENVEHCGGETEQADTGYYDTDEMHTICHSQGA